MAPRDPLASMYFRLDIGIDGVVDFLECTGLQEDTEIVEYGEGGENTFFHKFQGKHKRSKIVLKRGITKGSKALWAWREAASMRTKPQPKDCTLIILDDAMQEVERRFLGQVYPIRLIGPDLKADGNSIAIETLELDVASIGKAEYKQGPAPADDKKEGKEDSWVRANFSFSPMSPVEGEEVQLTDRSTSSHKITQWQWKAEGGLNASEQHPKHTWDKAGTYQITLKATNDKGKSHALPMAIIVTKDSLSAAFTPNPLKVLQGQKVTFTDQSRPQADIEKWEWSADKENWKASVQNPTAEFKELGKRTVTLKITSKKKKTAEATREVEVIEKLKADFSFTPAQPKLDEKVTFKDESTSSAKIEKWEWSGATLDNWKATDQHPTASFKKGGKHKLTLKVTNANQSTAEVTREIEIKDEIKVQFSFTPEKPNGGDEITFKDESTSGSKIVKWEWSDKLEGWKADTQHPKAKLKKGGKHEVTLKATNESGQSGTAMKVVEIKDNCPEFPALHFEFERDANPSYANRYHFKLVPEKGPNNENFAYIDWDFDEPLEPLGTRFVHQKKKHMVSFPKKGDTYTVKCGVRLQGYEDCWYVMEKQLVAGTTANGKSPKAKKEPYEKPQGTLKNKL